jgi:PAS domain S-box-containing protein
MEAEIFHLAAIVESSEDAIVGKSLDRIITSWNAGAERLYQYSAAEARGRPITILLPPERYDESVQIVERIVRGERIDHFETVHVRKDGRPVDVSLTISPIRDAAGKIAGASLISRDITERKRAEEAVRTAHAALERNREELRALAARLLTAQEEERRRVSRELHDDTSQKLALLIVEIETLERNLPGPASEILEQLRSFRERAADLSDDVHNLAYRLHPSILEDLGLAVALRSHVKDFASREGIKVRLTIRSLPPALPRELASCLYRVTQEGMRNAAKHSHTRRMAIMLTGSARGIHLSIKDWGLGFEPETLKARRGGLGIISMEERVRLMNGTFCLRSKIGRGTQVAVFLPLPEDLG